ncbi:MAG: DALR anticodon-binding domain-containing protein, partial [Burkholderiales bacterium]
AVKSFQALPEAESLAAANKRIRNILHKSPPPSADLFSRSRLVDPAEQALYAAFCKVDAEAQSKLDQEKFTDALCLLAALKAPVDEFFDRVMVNVDDPQLRNNRLLLLMQLDSAMNRVADISRLAI